MQVPRASLPALVVLIASISLGACGDDPPSGTGIVEIGTGALEFESLAEGQELPIVAGVQGGYHFVVNARMQNLIAGDPSSPNALGNPQTRFTIYLEDGTRVDNMIPPYRLGYRSASDGWKELPSGRVLQLDDQQIADDNLIPDIYGQTVRIVVQIRDPRGKEAEHEASVVAVAEELPDGADAGPSDDPDAGPTSDAGPSQ